MTKVQTSNFGTLYVQIDRTAGKILTRADQGQPYRTERRCERYYQIIQALPIQLVPPSVSPGQHAASERDRNLLKRETWLLNEQICRYIALKNDRGGRVNKNCRNEGIVDPDTIRHKIATDPYLQVWEGKRRACEATLERKLNALDGAERALAADASISP